MGSKTGDYTPRPRVPTLDLGCVSVGHDEDQSQNGLRVGGLDVVAPKAKLPEGVATFFADVDADKGHRLVVFGWAMPEDLAAGRLTR